ncbi:MAG: DUF1698 domain-containing protein [Planctomycetota bacterium]
MKILYLQIMLPTWKLASRASLERDRVLREMQQLAPWYQTFSLADWLHIEGPSSCEQALPFLDQHGFPADFTGKTVLDVGCNAGFFSFVAKSRGAERVVGVDADSRYLDQSRFIGRLLGLEVELVQDDVHNVARLGTFDVVICNGLLYHIHDPAAFLITLANVCRQTLLIECEFLVDPALTDCARFIEGEYRGDPTNWWIFGPRCLEGMVRAVGFARAGFEGFYYTPQGQQTREGLRREGRGFLIGRKAG